MRPTKKLDTRYNRREKYSNMVFMQPEAVIPLLAITGVVLYYTGKGISKLSGRKGKAATSTTRNILVGLAAIVVYLKIKDRKFEKNNESNQQYNPNDDYSEDEVPPPNDFIPKLRPPKINALNV